MRIRKNAKLLMPSPPLPPYFRASGAESSSSLMMQTHVCQLNQSPWDVVPFSPSSFQFECEDSFNGNGSLGGDSLGAVESVSSMMSIDARSDPIEINDNYDNKSGSTYKLSSRRGIFKSRKPNKRKPSNENDDVVDHEHDSATKGPERCVRRGRPRSAKNGSAAGNPNEFYYYSGFGPRWGKRRGGRKEEEVSKDSASTVTTEGGRNATSLCRIEERNNSMGVFDFVDEEDYDDSCDDDDDDNDNGGIKRMRKPVKARSLRSLM